MAKTCDECGCGEGELHDIFCLRERCPFCGDQLVGCGCISKVLKLTAEEQEALDEYLDDEEEPLKGINERWVAALEAKGRVPFR
jgi:hypothetical protein